MPYLFSMVWLLLSLGFGNMSRDGALKPTVMKRRFPLPGTSPRRVRSTLLPSITKYGPGYGLPNGVLHEALKNKDS